MSEWSENQGTDLVRVPRLVVRGAKDSNDSNSALFRLTMRLLTDIGVLENDSRPAVISFEQTRSKVLPRL